MRSGFCNQSNSQAQHAFCRMDGCTCDCHANTIADEPEQLAEVVELKPAGGEVFEVGVNPGLSDVAYFTDTALSASGAKMLLPKSCPAKYKAHIDGEVEKASKAMDFGTIVHTLILGAGKKFEVGKFDSWRTNASKEWAAEVRARRHVPVLEHDLERAKAVAEKIRTHPTWGFLFAEGEPEVALKWIDPETGITMRARLDFLRPKIEGKRRVIVDLKTSKSAHPEAFGKSIADYGYSVQDAIYEDGVKATGLDDDPLFLFVVAETEAPYCVTVGYLSADDLKLGRAQASIARRIFKECSESDHWPEYAEDLVEFSTPTYHRIQTEEFINERA